MTMQRGVPDAGAPTTRAPAGLVPSFDGQELTTCTGFSFEVRTAGGPDEPALAEFFAHVTHEDLRFRFLTAVQTVGAAQLDFLTHVDHRRTESYVALDNGVGCVLASAMLAAEEGLERAEVAIIVRSDFKHRGIGWRLLEFVSERAAEMGVRKLQSVESQDNHQAIELERAMGFIGRPYPGDSTLIILEKTLPAPHVSEPIAA